MPRFLSPKELAEAIGVSESSLKRWADEGLLAVSRTAGGHRRIALSEAVRYIRAAGHPIVKPQVLGLADLAAVPRAGADIDATLIEGLREGRAEMVRGIVVSHYVGGRSMAELCDGPLAQGMHAIGDLWRHGPEGIFIEHRAVELCIQALNQVRTLFPVPGKEDPVAVGGAMEGDPYTLPTLMAACVLGAAGWRAVNLGPDLPVDALLAAVKRHEPALVWLSCSVEAAAKTHEREVRKAGKGFSKVGIQTVVGGRGWKGIRWEGDSGLTGTGSMAEVSAFAEGLRAARARR